MSPHSPAHGTSTRDRIVREATLLFARQGIAGTRIADIEAAVGLAVGTGSFHRHFRNKDDVLDAVVRGALSEFEVPDLSVGGDADDLVRRIEAAVVTLQDNAVAIGLLVRLRVERPELAAKLHRGFQAWVTGSGAEPDPQATVITTAVVGYVISHQFFDRQPGRLDVEEFSRTLAAMAQRTSTSSR